MISKKLYHFLENSFSLFSVKLIDLAIAILLIPYLIIHVGVENYGVYAFAVSLMLVLVNIINYGFNLVAVRELAKVKHKQSKVTYIFNEVFSVKIYLTLFFLIVTVVLVQLIPSLKQYQLLYSFGLLFLIAELFSSRWFFLGIEKMKFLPAIHLGANLIFGLLIVLFIKVPDDFQYIILFEAIGLLVISLISFSFIVSEYKINVKIFSFQKVWEYLKQNFSSFINLMVPSLMSNMTVFFVGLLGVPQSTAVVQLSIKFKNAFTTINAILTKVFYPIVNRSFNIMKLASTVLISMGILLSVLMFFSADFLVNIWLKEESSLFVSKVILTIQLLSPTPLLMALISSFGINGLLVFYKDKTYSYITLTSLVIGLLAGSSLVLIWGNYYYAGAGFLLVARLSYAILSMLFLSKTKKSLKKT